MGEVPLYAGLQTTPSSAAVDLVDHSQVNMLGLRHTSVNFGAIKGPSSPNWRVQINCDRAKHLVILRKRESIWKRSEVLD